MRYRSFVMRAEDDERAQKAYLHLDMRERERKTFCSPFLSFVVINGTKTYLFANSRAQ